MGRPKSFTPRSASPALRTRLIRGCSQNSPFGLKQQLAGAAASVLIVCGSVPDAQTLTCPRFYNAAIAPLSRHSVLPTRERTSFEGHLRGRCCANAKRETPSTAARAVSGSGPEKEVPRVKRAKREATPERASAAGRWHKKARRNLRAEKS